MKKRPDFRNAGKKSAITTCVLFLLICLGFVYLYPLLYMIMTAIMTEEDLVNPTISWVPTRLDLSSFKKVWEVMDYPESLKTSVLYSLVCAIAQTFTCALAGYALSRFRVPGKKLWVVMLIFVFIIPTDVLMIPRYVLFNKFGLVGSTLSMILPALLGQGLKSSIFILIFMQAFDALPKSFDEAAQLDGANKLTVFFRVTLPLVVPSIVLCFLFSVVWYWNETTLLSSLVGSDFQSLPLQLERFNNMFNSATKGDSATRLNERYQFAATLLTILPLVIFYLVAQKQFVKGIESSGITGE